MQSIMSQLTFVKHKNFSTNIKTWTILVIIVKCQIVANRMQVLKAFIDIKKVVTADLKRGQKHQKRPAVSVANYLHPSVVFEDTKKNGTQDDDVVKLLAARFAEKNFQHVVRALNTRRLIIFK